MPRRKRSSKSQPSPYAATVARRSAIISGGRRSRLIPAGILLVLCALAGCSTLTGWDIPGTEKSALPTTKVYLVLENVETVPENLRTQGEIYVDDAFFGRTSRPSFYKFVGNDLVVGSVQIEKEKAHTIRVELPGYEPFEHTRHFGALPEYSIAFRLKRLEAGPAVVWESEAEAEQPEGAKWYEFWDWFEE